MISPSADLIAMTEAARAAGAGLRKSFGALSGLVVRSKSGPADLVSAADVMAEQTIRGMLERARPSYAFLGEEEGVSGGTDDAQTWITDPLDGTTNFLFACPLWGVNIALAREGRVVAGVTYLPALDELYCAETGKGTWLNGNRVRVSTRGTLVEALLACGIPFSGKPDHPLFAREMAELTGKVSGIRRTGSCAVDMAWVAAGRWDAYWERALCAWDMAAGVILVEEAGGVATSTTGGPLDLHGENVCVSNGAIHAALLERLDAALRGGAA